MARRDQHDGADERADVAGQVVRGQAAGDRTGQRLGGDHLGARQDLVDLAATLSTDAASSAFTSTWVTRPCLLASSCSFANGK